MARFGVNFGGFGDVKATSIESTGAIKGSKFRATGNGAVADVSFGWEVGAADDGRNGAYRNGLDDWLLTNAGAIAQRLQSFSIQLQNHTNIVGNLSVLSGGKIIFSGVTPAAIAANTNDWAPGSGTFIRASSTGAFNITGLVAGDVNETRLLINVGANNITLTHEDAASAAANRFTCGTGASIVVTPNDIALIAWDGTTTRWRASLIQ